MAVACRVEYLLLLISTDIDASFCLIKASTMSHNNPGLLSLLRQDGCKLYWQYGSLPPSLFCVIDCCLPTNNLLESIGWFTWLNRLKPGKMGYSANDMNLLFVGYAGKETATHASQDSVEDILLRNMHTNPRDKDAEDVKRWAGGLLDDMQFYINFERPRRHNDLRGTGAANDERNSKRLRRPVPSRACRPILSAAAMASHYKEAKYTAFYGLSPFLKVQLEPTEGTYNEDPDKDKIANNEVTIKQPTDALPSGSRDALPTRNCRNFYTYGLIRVQPTSTQDAQQSAVVRETHMSTATAASTSKAAIAMQKTFSESSKPEQEFYEGRPAQLDVKKQFFESRSSQAQDIPTTPTSGSCLSIDPGSWRKEGTLPNSPSVRAETEYSQSMPQSRQETLESCNDTDERDRMARMAALKRLMTAFDEYETQSGVATPTEEGVGSLGSSIDIQTACGVNSGNHRSADLHQIPEVMYNSDSGDDERSCDSNKTTCMGFRCWGKLASRLRSKRQ